MNRIELLLEWEATADILASEELSASLKQGKQQIAQGDWVTWDTLKGDV